MYKSPLFTTFPTSKECQEGYVDFHILWVFFPLLDESSLISHEFPQFSAFFFVFGSIFSFFLLKTHLSF